jgi:N-acetylmuramoyl-L-alanine amidase
MAGRMAVCLALSRPRRESGFERARLQPCQKASKINRALAPAGRFFFPLQRLPQVVKMLRTKSTKILAAAIALLPAAAVPTLNAQAPAIATRSVVVLDPAHGGDDSGAGLGSQPEKAYTLALSVRLRSLLAARGFQVVATRESDATVDADRRAAIANRANAMACLSLHATEAGSGVHIFVSSLAPRDEARFLPWKTAQAAWIMRSLALAGVLNSALEHAGMSVTLGRIGTPGIDSMTCPAVAVEVAPQRTPDMPGGESLDDPETQTRVAEALAAALVEWRSADSGAHEP